MKKNRNFISKIISKVPTKKSWIFWIIIALLVKTSFFIYKVSIENNPFHSDSNIETFADYPGDTSSYLNPIENLLITGNYSDDYRMPGYGWLYFILRLFFSISFSLNLMVIIQLILSAISVYVLAKIAYLIFEKEKYFYLTFGFYVISTFVSLLDYTLLPESFCASSLIFSIYFLVNSKNSKSYTLLSGLFLTWCIFLKPITTPLLLIFVLYCLLRDCKIRLNISNYKWITVLIFLIPFFIIDGTWIFRNYKHHKKIIPLTKSFYYPGINDSYIGSLYHFMNSYGGSIVHWLPGADITFFKPPPDFIKKKIEVTPPNYIYTSKFNYDSLLAVRNLIKEIEAPAISRNIKTQKEQIVIAKLNIYTKSIQEEKPFLFYISSRIKVLGTFFIHSGTYNLFLKASFELNKFEWLVKVFYSLLYVLVVIGGFIGSIYLMVKGLKNINFLLISSIGLYLALVYPVLLKLDEFRYFVPGYPIFLLACVYLLINISSKINNIYNHA